jgi:hypothetical protein
MTAEALITEKETGIEMNHLNLNRFQMVFKVNSNQGFFLILYAN